MKPSRAAPWYCIMNLLLCVCKEIQASSNFKFGTELVLVEPAIPMQPLLLDDSMDSFIGFENNNNNDARDPNCKKLPREQPHQEPT